MTDNEDYCSICNRTNDVEIKQKMLVDESGGGILYICEECRSRMRQDRCGICGNRKVGCSKSSGITFWCEGEDCEGHQTPVCEDCRSSLFEPPIGGVQGGFSVGRYTGSHDGQLDKEDRVQEEINYQNGSQGKQHYYE